MFEDIDAAPDVSDVVAVNCAGILYREPIQIWACAHGTMLVDFMEERRALGYDMHFRALGNFTRNQQSGDVERYNRSNWGGSSALYATRIALEEGWDRVILCGVPLTGRESLGIYADQTGYQVYRVGWEKHLNEIKDYVRSMSGWTKELLGEPTAEWLNS